MSGALNEAGATLALNKVFRNTGTSPSTLYAGLATVAIDKDDTLAQITELSTSGYTREVITFGAPTTGNDGTDDYVEVANDLEAVFDLSADAPSVAFGFVTDASAGTSGTIYWRGTGSAVDPASTEDIKLAVGDVKIRIAVSPER